MDKRLFIVALVDRMRCMIVFRFSSPLVLRFSDGGTEGHSGDHCSQGRKSNRPQPEDAAVAAEHEGQAERRELVENLRYDGESSDGYDEKEDVKNPGWQPQDTEDSSHL